MDCLLPALLDPIDIVLLVGLSLLSSALTAAVGAGGGLLMLSAMANLLPAAVIIPVHGMVQLGSNVGRVWLARSSVSVALARPYLLGAVLGAAIGTTMVMRLPPVLMQMAIALFVLWLCWAPSPRFLSASRRLLPLFGAIMTLLSLFVGAIGPPVTAFLQRLAPDRLTTVSTAALCMSGSHLLKLLAFGVGGFAWQAWLGITALLIAAGFVGTSLGLRLLHQLPEQRFRSALKVVLSLLALRLLWIAAGQALAATGV